MVKIAITAILAGIVIFLGAEVWYFNSQVAVRSSTVGEMRAELKSTLDDQKQLESDRDYYKDPANLEKELRERFNYRAPGESMMILVPEPTSTTSTDQTP